MVDSIQRAGSVKIAELKLISANGSVWDLRDFLIELNIYEDIFSNYLYGTIVLSDSLNLIQKVPVIGEEYLNVNVITPTMPDKTGTKIQKTFRVFKLSDRNIARDNSTQTFILHFASIELFTDVLLPLFIPFEGNIRDVAGNIFSNFISTSRDYKINETSDSGINKLEIVNYDTPLIVLDDTANKVKFVSPGWSPFKCLNWLASKAISKTSVAKNFLFFETSKAFYFGSIDHIFQDSIETKNYIGEYTVAASNIRDGAATPDLSREYFLAKDVDMIDTSDHIKNYTNGYLANRLITMDVYNKEFRIFDYDHIDGYSKQYHTSGWGVSGAPFTSSSLRNPATNISFYPVNPKLYDNFENNVNEKMEQIHGNRKSSLLDLSNIKMHITVPGRTDVEAGRLLKFKYPALGPKNTRAEEGIDTLYSGYYLITAIHHKISRIEHTMRMECVKDSISLGELPFSG